MRFIHKLLFLALAFSAVFVSACDPDDPIVNEEELITTLRMTLTPAGGGTPVVLSFVDLDGDGGNAPVITGGTLAANTTYTGALTILNESETPVEDITEEIETEDDEHQFFFTTSAGLNLTVSYADQDGNNNPVGLATSAAAGAASTGTLTVTLRHEPNKTAAGVKEGDITNAGGETDIEVVFPVTIQ